MTFRYGPDFARLTVGSRTLGTSGADGWYDLLPGVALTRFRLAFRGRRDVPNKATPAVVLFMARFGKVQDEWFGRGLLPSQLLVLCALSLFADEHGVCWPSVRTISTKTGLSKDTVSRALHDLSATDLLTITNRGRRKPRLLRLSVPIRDPLSVRPDTASVPNGTLSVSQSTAPNSFKNRIKENSRPRTPIGAVAAKPRLCDHPTGYWGEYASRPAWFCSTPNCAQERALKAASA